MIQGKIVLILIIDKRVQKTLSWIEKMEEF